MDHGKLLHELNMLDLRLQDRREDGFGRGQGQALKDSRLMVLILKSELIEEIRELIEEIRVEAIRDADPD